MTELDRIMALTDRIEELVAASSWADAAALEGERRALLQQYVANNPRAAEDLRQLQLRARETLRLAEQQRSSLCSESGAYLHRLHALRAYLDRSGAGGASHRNAV